MVTPGGPPRLPKFTRVAVPVASRASTLRGIWWPFSRAWLDVLPMPRSKVQAPRQKQEEAALRNKTKSKAKSTQQE